MFNRTYHRMLAAAFATLVYFVTTAPAFGWGAAHRWIREWAVDRLPSGQIQYVGQAHLRDLATKYTSLQDAHAGGRSPHLDRYCVIPGVRVSLHDVNPVAPTFTGIQWYLKQFIDNMRAGQRDEAMKFLGVLCHWCEDPGSLSAHSSPVSEAVLRQLLPPSPGLANRNYLYGAGWIGLEKNVGLDDTTYQPKLLGATITEAAVHITQRQRMLKRHNSGLIVPAVLGKLENDQARYDKAVGDATAYNARFVADIIHTAITLAADRFDDAQLAGLTQQPLTDWVSDYRGGGTSHPYYVVPFIKNQAMDAKRRLHPLTVFDASGKPEPVAFGLGMGAPFALHYTLPNAGVFESFRVRVGLHPTAGEQGAVAFVILINGKTAAQTKPIPAGAPAQLLTVNLPANAATLKLTLQTIPAQGSNQLHNLTVWAEPTLLRGK